MATVYPITFNQSCSTVGNLNYEPNEVAAFPIGQALWLVAQNIGSFQNPTDQTNFSAQVYALQLKGPGIYPPPS